MVERGQGPLRSPAGVLKGLTETLVKAGVTIEPQGTRICGVASIDQGYLDLQRVPLYR